jgi:glutaredoxin
MTKLYEKIIKWFDTPLDDTILEKRMSKLRAYLKKTEDIKYPHIFIQYKRYLTKTSLEELEYYIKHNKTESEQWMEKKFEKMEIKNPYRFIC